LLSSWSPSGYPKTLSTEPPSTDRTVTLHRRHSVRDLSDHRKG